MLISVFCWPTYVNDIFSFVWAWYVEDYNIYLRHERLQFYCNLKIYTKFKENITFARCKLKQQIMRKKLFNYKGSSGGDPFPQEACPVKVYVWNNLSGILRNNLNFWFCTKQQIRIACMKRPLPLVQPIHFSCCVSDMICLVSRKWWYCNFRWVRFFC